MNQLIINESTIFYREYEKLTPALKEAVRNEIENFKDGWKNDYKTVSKNYQRLEGSEKKILEFKPTKADRFFGHWEPNILTLLRVGDHDTTTKVKNNNIDTLISTAKPARNEFKDYAHNNFWKKTFNSNKVFKDEALTSWCYSLGDEQSIIFEDLKKSIDDSFLRNEQVNHVVLGGPGTGKTIILLQLLYYIQTENYSVHLKISDSLKKQLGRALPINFPIFENFKQKAEILLVDDPDNFCCFEEIEPDQYRVVIAFVDPLQMTCTQTDEDIEGLDATIHKLTECYRQKKAVGEAAFNSIDRIAKSTPYLDRTKIKVFTQERKLITEISNNINFVNSGGYTNSHEDFTEIDFQNELSRISSVPKSKTLDWLLIAFLDIARPNEISIVNNDITIVDHTELEIIKGLEYQHAFCYMTKQLFQELTKYKFKGTGVRIYDQRRLFRIPLTRAKDSVVLFALP